MLLPDPEAYFLVSIHPKDFPSRWGYDEPVDGHIDTAMFWIRDSCG